jgi:ATP dependent DNA ligase domain
MARRDPLGIRLLTRNGHDWSPRYPLIVEAVNRLKVRSCLIDGEAVACDENGLAVFEQLRRKPSGKHVFLFAFDLLELDGQDLRREPLETRKATLASLLRGSLPGLRLNEHLAHDGESVFRHACKMGLRGYRVEAARLALPLGPVEGLAEIQEPARFQLVPPAIRSAMSQVESQINRSRHRPSLEHLGIAAIRRYFLPHRKSSVLVVGGIQRVYSSIG